jgi:diphthamide synthase subunit DPH2
MIFRYPEEIENLMKIWRPYGKKLYMGEIDNIPPEAIKAYNECKKWAWEQGQ